MRVFAVYLALVTSVSLAGRVPVEARSTPDAAQAKIYFVTQLGRDLGQYVETAVLLAKQMHDLRHVHPLIIMVQEHSPLAPRITAINAAFKAAGWKSSVKAVKKVPFTGTTGRENWDEAYQRIAAFGLDPREVSQFFFMDADFFLLKNIDHLAERSDAPVFARRMGGCYKQEEMQTNAPVTNFFIAKPNATQYQRMIDAVKARQGRAKSEVNLIISAVPITRKLNAGKDQISSDQLMLSGESTNEGQEEQLLDRMEGTVEEDIWQTIAGPLNLECSTCSADTADFEESALNIRQMALGAQSSQSNTTGILSSHVTRQHSLFDTTDAIYFDCFKNMGEETLQIYDRRIPGNLRAIHQGIPGREVLRSILGKPTGNGGDLRRESWMSPFIDTVTKNYVKLMLQPDVIDVLRAFNGK